jgi:hypothetical protein
MKKIIALTLICAAAILGAAEKNLAPAQWAIYGKNSEISGTTLSKEGVASSFIKQPGKFYTGLVSAVKFAQPLTGSLTFGGESKATDVKGNAPHNYCVYLDITYADGTKLYGQTAVFSTGTHDWEKKSTTIKLAKPIKDANVYVIFRNITGKAEFRNIFIYNK